MKQNSGSIIRIILAIIFIIIFFKGLGGFLPLLILLATLWLIRRGGNNRSSPVFAGWLAKIKNTMIDHDSITSVKSSLRNIRGISAAILVIIVIAALLMVTITVVPAGNVGVVDFFGRVSQQELEPGIQFKIPLSRVMPFSIQTQDYTMTGKIGEGQVASDDSISALTKEGLTLGLDITVLYHLEKNNAPRIYKEIGRNYESKILRPSIRSVIREIVAQYQAEDLYSQKRAEAAEKILSSLKTKAKNRGIAIEEVLLRNVTLPTKLADSIEDKLKAEQESKRFDFVLEKEKKEADRKRIAAEGQRDSQKIINESLTDRYLQYLYIQELKDRQGTIYVPINPQNGLPLFKGL